MTEKEKNRMLKRFSIGIAGVLLMQPVRGYDVVPTDAMCAAMLAEIKACFAGTQTVEQFTNEWKWGDIRTAFAFDFMNEVPENAAFCTVLGVCPLSFETSLYSLEEKEDLFVGRWPHVSDFDKCYWAFGVKADRISVRRQSLAFVYCSKRSAMYPLALKHLGLKEPKYEDARSKYSSLCWDTVVHNKARFEPSFGDIQVVPWGMLDAKTDVVYFFNWQNCLGVMLLNRKSVLSKSEPRNVSPSLDPATRDFRKFSKDFKWIPDHQAERFVKWNSERRAQGGRDTSYLLNQDIDQYQDNGDLMKYLGIRFLGILRHPEPMHYYAPWSKFNYYESPGGDMTLLSVWGDRDWIERVQSFVLDVKKLPEEARILLPYGLDIKPYLHTPPSSRVLYEHVRADKRARIVVQPHIVYLYEDNRLSKILVCNDENGPPDHGWSLVREFYVCTWTGYFWPVTRAYSPLE